MHNVEHWLQDLVKRQEGFDSDDTVVDDQRRAYATAAYAELGPHWLKVSSGCGRGWSLSVTRNLVELVKQDQPTLRNCTLHCRE